MFTSSDGFSGNNAIRLQLMTTSIWITIVTGILSITEEHEKPECSADVFQSCTKFKAKSHGVPKIGNN